ncbi:MAG TPA: ATP-dependent DNA helicase RecG [Planctomycetaceae bacterium]|nr:ATP-dependent DNA helicase RecG [Planctomycetaceae bacterium]
MPDDPLQQPVQFLRGAGPQRAELLARLGIESVGDLLWFLPRDVLDLTEITPVHKLRAGELASVRGSVVDIDGRDTSGGGSLVAVLLDCDGEYVRGVWFNQPWMLKKFDFNQTVLFSGKPKRHERRWEINNPRVQWLEGDAGGGGGGIVPRYRLTEGLLLDELRRILRAAVDEFAPLVPEHLPEAFREAFRLPRLPQALAWLHFPASMDEYEGGRRRLVFDDLLEFQFGLALRRRAWRKTNEAPRLETTAKIDARIRRLFPFDFTKGQLAAVQEIAADLASGRAMHRLLQADVGAGKTVVAIYAMLVAIAAGYQAVLMAPTEVLANQHWRTLERALTHSRVNRLLLTGQLTPAERRRALADVKTGAAQLIVGTQAVIQSDVEFHKLGVAVIDEQHKFGVMQRARFAAQSSPLAPRVEDAARSASGQQDDSARGASGLQQTPHVLVMTATPIPRSLCLTQFGDLDITVIQDLPPGRQKVVTSRVSNAEQRRRAWEFVRRQVAAGRQAYVICPRVEGDEETADETPGAAPHLEQELSESAEDVHRQLASGELQGIAIGLVHGRMDHRQKDAAMFAFRTGETRVLVATTVVEVGVDVPNATLIVINQAHRFGLSQLHQLRGRIARGKFQGYCFLFSESNSPDAVRRLAALEETSDGFKIAEVDFELRGPGDVLGTRQHGEMPLKVASIVRDHEILREARKAAFDLVERGELDQPEFAPLKTRVLDRFGRVMELPQTG